MMKGMSGSMLYAVISLCVLVRVEICVVSDCSGKYAFSFPPGCCLLAECIIELLSTFAMALFVIVYVSTI